MTSQKSSFKKRALAAACVGVLAVLPVAYLASAQAERQEHGTPVFTDPIVGAWNCTIPPAGGAPAFNDVKNIHCGRDAVGDRRCGSPVSGEPYGRHLGQDRVVDVHAKGISEIMGRERQLPGYLALPRPHGS